jgi:hypothetical protein
MNEVVLVSIDAHTLLLPLVLVLSIVIARLVARALRPRRPSRTLRVVVRAPSRTRRAA